MRSREDGGRGRGRRPAAGMAACGVCDGHRRWRRQQAVASAGGVASMGGRQRQAAGAAEVGRKGAVGEGGAGRERGGQRHVRWPVPGAKPVRWHLSSGGGDGRWKGRWSGAAGRGGGKSQCVGQEQGLWRYGQGRVPTSNLLDG